MTAQHTFIATNSAGTREVTGLRFDGLLPGATSSTTTIRILNAGATDATSVTLHACRGDQYFEAAIGEDSDTSARMGKELIDETWLQARVGAGAWTPLDELANGLSLGAIAAAAYVAVDLRLVVPSAAATFGNVYFNLLLRSQ